MISLNKISKFDKPMNGITTNDEPFITPKKNIVGKNGTVYINSKKIKEGLSGDMRIAFTGDPANPSCTFEDIYGTTVDGCGYDLFGI